MSIKKNEFTWRVMPGDEAMASERFHERNFTNGKDAKAFQKRVKKEFPNEPCSLIHFESPWEWAGKSFRTRAEAVAARDAAAQYNERFNSIRGI